MPKPEVTPGQAKKEPVCSLTIGFEEQPSNQTEGRIDATISVVVTDGGGDFWQDNQTWYDCHEEFADWVVEQLCKLLDVESLPATLSALSKQEINWYQRQLHKLESYLLDVGSVTADEDRPTKEKLVKEKFKAGKKRK